MTQVDLVNAVEALVNQTSGDRVKEALSTVCAAKAARMEDNGNGEKAAFFSLAFKLSGISNQGI